MPGTVLPTCVIDALRNISSGAGHGRSGGQKRIRRGACGQSCREHVRSILGHLHDEIRACWRRPRSDVTGIQCPRRRHPKGNGHGVRRGARRSRTENPTHRLRGATTRDLVAPPSGPRRVDRRISGTGTTIRSACRKAPRRSGLRDSQFTLATPVLAACDGIPVAPPEHLPCPQFPQWPV